jgi:CheY-like chemotaxis protein
MPPKQSEKILVVDGDPDVVSLIADQVLAPLGYHVATAHDGPSALQLMLQMVPDILVTSMGLPGLSGRDLLTAMHSQGLDTSSLPPARAAPKTSRCRPFASAPKTTSPSPCARPKW